MTLSSTDHAVTGLSSGLRRRGEPQPLAGAPLRTSGSGVMETSLDFTIVMTVSATRVPDLYERVLADSRFAVFTPLAVPVTVSV
jgi:hypothetical protein